MTKTTKASKDTAVKAKKTTSKKAAAGGGGKKDGKSAEEKILEALAAHHARKRGEALERETLLKRIGISPKTLSNNLPKLKEKGLVAYAAKTIQLTEAGVEHCGPMADSGSTNEEVQNRLKSDLKPKELAMVEILMDGEAHAKNDVAKSLGLFEGTKPTKGFVNLAGGMRGRGLIDYPTKGFVQLDKETWFPY